MAETTTITISACIAATIDFTRLMFPALATEVPPNFNTFMNLIVELNVIETDCKLEKGRKLARYPIGVV
jgi:hypothetical protein